MQPLLNIEIIKKILLTFLAVFALGLQVANAQTGYGIYINSVQITSDNANNFTTTNLSGIVTYNDNTHVLTLDNVSAYSLGFVEDVTGDITVNFSGNCQIETYLNNTSGHKVSFYGQTSTAQLSAGAIYGEYAGSDIELANGIFRIDEDLSAYWGIGLSGSGRENLTITNAEVYVIGSTCAVDNWNSITLNNCEILAPVGAAVENGCIRLNGNHIANQMVHIVPIAEPGEYYGITVGNTDITEENCSNVTDSALTRGTVTFDTITNTLTLSNIILAGDINAEEFDRGDLIVEIRGNCIIDNSFYCSYLHNTTINGSTNDVLKTQDISIYATDDAITLTINNITVLVGDGDGVSWDMDSYSLYGYGNENIVLNNVELSSWANECPFDEFLSITLNNCHITYPVGAVVEDGCIRLNNSHNIDSVHIAREIVGLDIVADRNFTLAPNPAVDMVEFQGININGTARVSIYNAEGKLVAGVEVSDTNNLRMDVSSLATGIYTVQVIGGKTRYTSKLVKK